MATGISTLVDNIVEVCHLGNWSTGTGTDLRTGCCRSKQHKLAWRHRNRGHERYADCGRSHRDDSGDLRAAYAPCKVKTQKTMPNFRGLATALFPNSLSFLLEEDLSYQTQSFQGFHGDSLFSFPRWCVRACAR